ncbi:hypothetical protein NPIL_362491 [Nephila pilipes]|uniref:Uncharacterized protein n=1 Tax=Nephila pilipes TaxID=299642 RepID=A0A8X6TUM1_NEPPI|nr:hypothetical protein NPIL_362491 [Nephila pilipes]
MNTADKVLTTDDVSEWLIGDKEENYQFLMNDNIIEDGWGKEVSTYVLCVNMLPHNTAIDSLPTALFGQKKRMSPQSNMKFQNDTGTRKSSFQDTAAAAVPLPKVHWQWCNHRAIASRVTQEQFKVYNVKPMAEFRSGDFLMNAFQLPILSRKFNLGLEL